MQMGTCDVEKDAAMPLIPTAEFANNDEAASDARRLWLVGDVDIEQMEIAKRIVAYNCADAELPYEERAPIRLYINSDGGDVDVMWALVDCIAVSETPIYTINMGMAGSAAAVIFMAGHQRMAMPHATFMFHKGCCEAIGGTYAQMFSIMQALKADDKRQREFILNFSRITGDEYEQLFQNDWYIDADEAIKYGVADEIVKTINQICVYNLRDEPRF